jgi:hypothetical protein
MWERTVGVPATSCLPSSARLTRRGLGALRLGQTPEQLLFAGGQPSSRPGRSYRYCVTGGKGQVATVFDGAGHSVLVASTATRHRAGAVRPGSRATVARRGAKSLGHGWWLGPRMPGGRRYAYGVRGGRVRWVAVLTRSEAHTARLRGDLRAAGLAA